jgi:hypothetical protein
MVHPDGMTHIEVPAPVDVRVCGKICPRIGEKMMYLERFVNEKWERF